MTLEQELIDIFASSPFQRNRDILIGYYGWEDGRQHTLTEVGARFGITRERVRQVCAKLTKKAKTSTIAAPTMDRVLALISSRLPCSAAQLEAELAQAGVDGGGHVDRGRRRCRPIAQSARCVSSRQRAGRPRGAARRPARANSHRHGRHRRDQAGRLFPRPDDGRTDATGDRQRAKKGAEPSLRGADPVADVAGAGGVPAKRMRPRCLIWCGKPCR